MPYFRSKKNSCNKKIHKKILKPSTPSCTRRVISSWSLNGDCLQSSLFYICKENTPIVKENQPHNISLKENNFNFINLSKNLKILKNYYFFIKREINTTELPNLVWENKRENNSTKLAWRVLQKVKIFKPKSKKCTLCTREKYLIVFSKEMYVMHAREISYSILKRNVRYARERNIL